MFFLPNRRPRFELVDHVLACIECLTPVGAGNRDRNGNLADSQIAGSVRDRDLARTKAIPCFRCDAFKFANGHFFVRFVREAADGTIVVRTLPHNSGERHNGAAHVGSHALRERRNVYRFADDGEHLAPADGRKQRYLVTFGYRFALHHQTAITCDARRFR